MSRNLKKEQTEAEPNGDHLSDDNILKSQFFYAIYLFVLSGILIGISTGFGNILYSLGSMFSAMLVLAFIPGVIWFVGELRNRRDRSKNYMKYALISFVKFFFLIIGILANKT